MTRMILTKSKAEELRKKGWTLARIGEEFGVSRYTVWRTLNPKKFKEHQRKYRQTEKYKECQSKYHQTEKYKEYQRKYQQSEKFKEHQRKYYQKVTKPRLEAEREKRR